MAELPRRLTVGSRLLWLGVGVAFALGGSPPQDRVDGPTILRQVDRSLSPPAYEAYKRLINVEPSGRTREYLLYQVADGQDKVAALFLAPPGDKGRSTLRDGSNMWLFVPNAGKPIRITSLQSIVGGVFNNADILSLDYSTEYDVAGVQESGAEYLLDLKAKTGAVAYDRLRMWVSRKATLPVRIECLTATSVLVKSLHFSEVTDFGGGIVRPARVETDSPLHKGYKSTMLFVQMKARRVPPEVFTLPFMPNLESIRR